GVPYAFAKEAQAEGLIRPDGGRGTRVRRYRPKLATWLGKLHRYRAAGMEWEAIRDWTRRRWLPGHDHERQEPGDLANVHSERTNAVNVHSERTNAVNVHSERTNAVHTLVNERTPFIHW